MHSEAGRRAMQMVTGIFFNVFKNELSEPLISISNLHSRKKSHKILSGSTESLQLRAGQEVVPK